MPDDLNSMLAHAFWDEFQRDDDPASPEPYKIAADFVAGWLREHEGEVLDHLRYEQVGIMRVSDFGEAFVMPANSADLLPEHGERYDVSVFAKRQERPDAG